MNKFALSISEDAVAIHNFDIAGNSNVSTNKLKFLDCEKKDYLMNSVIVKI